MKATLIKFPNSLMAATVANDADNVPFTDVISVEPVPIEEFKIDFRANSKDRWRTSFPCRTNPTE